MTHAKVCILNIGKNIVTIIHNENQRIRRKFVVRRLEPIVHDHQIDDI